MLRILFENVTNMLFKSKFILRFLTFQTPWIYHLIINSKDNRLNQETLEVKNT